MKHKIVLVPFPFDDLSGAKPRPAACLTNPTGPHRHIVIAFITSQQPSTLMATDIALSDNAPDFAQVGLKVSSILRLHRLVTVSEALIRRELGTLPPRLQVEVDEKLRKLFDLD